MGGVIVRRVCVEGAVGDDPVRAELRYGLDVQEGLRELGTGSVHVVCTSPPYWGLRDYGTEPQVWGGDAACAHDWQEHLQPAADGTRTMEGNSALRAGHQGSTSATMKPKTSAFCLKCSAWRGQLGLEPTPELFVAHLVDVFREVRRVLRDDGTLWLNLGDSYCSTGPGTMGDPIHRRGIFAGVREDTAIARQKMRPETPLGMKPKDLVGIPWMVAFALRADGWYLRSDIVWAKGNCMPESVRDRPTKSHEYVFLLTKSEKYYYDLDAIREAHTSSALVIPWRERDYDQTFLPEESQQASGVKGRPRGVAGFGIGGRNKRSVWFVNPRPYPGAHFATWPEELVRPMVMAGSSERGCCLGCGVPWHRVVDRVAVEEEKAGVSLGGDPSRRDGGVREVDPTHRGGNQLAVRTVGTDQWEPGCSCGLGVGRCVVLDPFSGSATTGRVAIGLGRNYIGLDLNEGYLPLAEARLRDMSAPVGEAAPVEDLISELFGHA